MLHSAIARLAVLVLVAAFSTFADGASRIITGTLAPGGPTMPVVAISTPNCTTQLTTPVLYRAYPFTVDVGGTYTFTEPGTNDGLYVHAGAFDPDNSFPTCIAASNTNPINIGVNLVPGTSYTVVIFDDMFAQTGLDYTLTISGPGNIIAPCAGFTDVDLGSVFCPNVEWLRNRAITLGCTSATLYCPNDPVSRLAMAAFLNRLGNALEPRFAHQTQTAAQAAANADGIVCQTIAVDTGTYPRVASLSSVMFYHQAPGTVRVSTKLIYSINAGVTWADFSGVPTFAANVAGSTVSQSPAARPLLLPPETSVLFGIRVDTPSATLSDAGCELAVRLDSHTGASGAFDPRAAPPPPGNDNRPSRGP
jgi:hypothetical protein